MKKVAYILILTFTISSCHETIVDLEVGGETPKLVIGGLINTDSAVVVKVTRTVHVLETDVEYGVTNASISLFENERLSTEFLFDTGGTDAEIDDIYVSMNQFVPSEGNTYSILVEADGYLPARASTNIPAKVPVLDFEVDSTLVQVGEFLNGVNASITFQDPPGVENFYSIVIREEFRMYNAYDEFGEPIEEDGFTEENIAKALLPRLDNKVEYDGKANFEFEVIYLSDIAFDGLAYTYDFLMHAPNEEGKLTVYLNHITEDHYQYGTTSQLQLLEATENPFSQPVQVFTNIQNGLGIFSGYQSSSITIDVP